MQKRDGSDAQGLFAVPTGGAADVKDWVAYAVRLVAHERATSLSAIRVVDIGCGDGSIARAVAQWGLDVTGVDCDEQALARARSLSDRMPSDQRPRWIVADGQYLQDWPEACYDLAILWYVAHHMTRPEAGIAAAWRVLKPGGRLVLADKVSNIRPVAGDGDCLGCPLLDWIRWIADVKPYRVELSVPPTERDLFALLEKA